MSRFEASGTAAIAAVYFESNAVVHRARFSLSNGPKVFLRSNTAGVRRQ